MFHLNDSQCYPLFVRNVNGRSFTFFFSRHRQWFQIGGSRDGKFLFLILGVDVYLHKWGYLWIILVQGYTWFSLTWWDGLVGVQNNGKIQLKFCITIESNFGYCSVHQHGRRDVTLKARIVIINARLLLKFSECLTPVLLENAEIS